MSIPRLPSPGDQDNGRDRADQAETSDDGSPQPRQGKGPRIPSIDEILGMLLQLNGLVTLGLISPAKANVLQRNLRTILDVLQKRTRTDQHELAPEALAGLCRDNPQLLNLLAPFLSEEQMACFLNSLNDGFQEHS
jgi:hypothetical protein